MSRYHFMLIFAIIIAAITIPLYVKAVQLNRFADEKKEIKRDVEYAVLAATYSLKENIGTRTYIENVVHDYFDALAIATDMTKENCYAYTPALVILDTTGFYLNYPTETGYHVATSDEIRPYTSVNDPTKRVTLTGEKFETGVYVGMETDTDLIRSYVQTSIEEAAQEQIQLLNDEMELPDYAYEFPTEVVVTPDISVLVIFQGYPLQTKDAYYECVLQSTGQISK